LKIASTKPKSGDIAAKPTFRVIDGVPIRFVESDPGNSDALLLSPWPESVLAYEPTWPRLAETTHLVAIDPPGDRPGFRTSAHGGSGHPVTAQPTR